MEQKHGGNVQLLVQGSSFPGKLKDEVTPCHSVLGADRDMAGYKVIQTQQRLHKNDGVGDSCGIHECG